MENSYKVNWRIEDVISGREFDPTRRWLPSRLSGADAISCLNDDEKRQLTHVEMGAYAHLFAFTEEFIAPTINALAQDFAVDQRAGFDALTNFAAEEIKHMNLFRQVRAIVDEAVGFQLELIGGEREVAHVVMSKNIGAVLLLIAAIEWFTQIHYTEGFADDEAIDPFTKVIFKAHWQEESQHAQMDHLETLRAFGPMSDEEKDQAITDLIDLVAVVDGLLQLQTTNDVANLGRYLGREFSDAERDEITAGVLAAKRWTFIESGVFHPNFQATFGEVTSEAQQEKVQSALATIL